MLETKKIKLNQSAIKPRIDLNKTQMILERHCNYDRETGMLIKESADYQKKDS